MVAKETNLKSKDIRTMVQDELSKISDDFKKSMKELNHSPSDKKEDGGNTDMAQTGFCPTCGGPSDWRHLVTELDIEKDRHQRDMKEAATEKEKQGAVLTALEAKFKAQLKEANDYAQSIFEHIDNPSVCKDPENCELSQHLAKFRHNTLTVQDVADWLKSHNK